MENNKTISLSIPKSIIEEIDTSRGDISRSKFILRLMESKFQDNSTKEAQNNIESLQKR
jgi:metal-responsive CopG/Arc/MetJ family transcriptional regulator